MTVRHAIWTVGPQPKALAPSVLPSEQMLEDMIVATPEILSDQWMLIGRQENTGFGGRIDLLAIAPDGALVLIEIKKDRTPREVVAQALDYACWLETLRPEDVAAVYGRFAPGRRLGDDFRHRFGQDLDEDAINQSHQIIIVAAAIDDSTTRIISYLSAREIPINVLCFQVFSSGGDQFVSRAWLIDPMQTQASTVARPDDAKEPWNGEIYVSFGNPDARSWKDAVRYGFISAGNGAWYSNTLNLLRPGDRIWVNVPGVGYVGVGIVTGPRETAKNFTVQTESGEAPVLDVAQGGHYHRQYADDPDRCEYFVPVRWLQTVPRDQAVKEIGLFGNQNTVCKPVATKWRSTIDRLKQRFPNHEA
ncbi:MAG: nuclease [Rhodospirillaceae bacterium BRH_c57]|nr:MAG: nuclease [Rhodospirillaceae bacterium BRH_c57]